MNIDNSRVIPEKKKRRGLLLFQIFVVIGFLAAMWISFGQNVLAPQNSAAPEQWQKLALVSTIEGDEALSSVSRLHGTEIILKSAYIAEYAGDTGRATAWVSRAVNEEEARKLLDMMVRGIARGGAGFSNMQQKTIVNQEVFQVDGPGGAHFFYIPGGQREKVIWLTVNAADVLPILETAIKIF